MHNALNSTWVFRGRGWRKERNEHLTQEAESLFESGVGLVEICRKESCGGKMTHKNVRGKTF